MSSLFANICKAGVESEPRLLEVVSWRETHRRTDQSSETYADSRVVERSAQQHSTNFIISISYHIVNLKRQNRLKVRTENLS